MNRSEMIDSNKLRIDVHSSSSSDDRNRVEHEAQEVAAAREAPPLGWSHHYAAAGGASSIGNNSRRLLSKQLSMKETTREAKWEKRRRQILQRRSMVSVVREEGDGHSGGRRSDYKSAVNDRHHVVRSSSERVMRCLTDEDLDELRGSFELGFGFDETGGDHLRDTLPALDFYFAVNRQLSDPKLRMLAASPTSTLSAVSSSSTLPDSPSPGSPIAATAGSGADTWKIFCPGENPQLVKTRLRHWAQVVACSIKHGC